MTVKNFWSLQVDEAIVAEKLKTTLGKDYEVFFPVNSQLKNIDLIFYNLKNGKALTIQVKGSRTYRWDVNELRSWHQVKKDSIFNPKNRVDFFIFVWHVEKMTKTKRSIEQAYLVIPIEQFIKKLKEKKMRKNKTYHFSFWTNLKDKANDGNNQPGYWEIDFSKYLNNFALLKK